MMPATSLPSGVAFSPSCLTYLTCLTLQKGLLPGPLHNSGEITAACDMVRAGVPLSEIGQVLRHGSLVTTAIYARVDLDSLRSLAQPWPGSDSR